MVFLIPSTKLIDAFQPKLLILVAEIRKSNRTYDPRICPQTGLKFIPTHKKQMYSSRQAQIDYNNDQRAIRNKEVNKFTSVLKVNREILRMAHEKLIELKQHAVSKDLLVFSGFDLNAFSNRQLNSKSGQTVYWSMDYGIEGLDIENKSFIIHKK
jgi:hypothetical protein